MTQSSTPLNAAIAVTRFGLGARPGELAVAAADPQGWLKAQITQRGADQPQGPLPSGRERYSGFLAYRADVRTLKQTAATPKPDGRAMDAAAADQLKAQRQLARAPLREGFRDEVLARAHLAATTPAPFRERWALFWGNHFTVSAAKGKAAPLAGAFEREAIRPHVFGRFEDMLVACSTHPGMLTYLDQARSAGPNSPGGTRRGAGLNENLAREILELHTVGADAGYAQADVTEFARALTGYSIGGERDGQPSVGVALFRPNLHEPGARTVMGRRYTQGDAGQARAILADLAVSPRTADHLARKLAVHFVADAPSPALVAQLSSAYLSSRGDLSVVAAALIDAPEAWAPQAAKFKRPYEFLISSYRAAGVTPSAAEPDLIQALTVLGERPLSAPQPNGWSEQASDWAAPDAIVKRLTWASRFAASRTPTNIAPVEVADAALGSRLTPPTRTAIARAETRPEAMTLLLMSPEFQRR